MSAAATNRRTGLFTPPLSDGEQATDYILAALDESAPKRPAQYERKMGDTELSYFLPSRQTGVNDMYLHLGFRAPDHLVKRSRVQTVWAILRLRHPLLSAHVEMRDYDDVRFIYAAPTSAEDAYCDAGDSLEYKMQSKDELIDSYLNGPRTLSNSRLSHLIVARPSGYSDSAIPTPPLTPTSSSSSGAIAQVGPDDAPKDQHELLICAMHFLGDGMALHQFATDFFALLGSDKTERELSSVLADEWRMRWSDPVANPSILPSPLEDNMPLSLSNFRRAAADVDFQMSQQKLVGGQAFPRKKHPVRRTIVPTIAISEERTKAILKKCKANGVSISAALFAICNIAWARVGGGDRKLPALMYSALNLRPYFTVRRPSPWDSYWFLAIGYFNVILPNFLPRDDRRIEGTFWHRARQAKEQSTRAAKSPLVASRTHEMAKERGERSRGWAKEDDEKEKGIWTPPTPPSESVIAQSPREPVLPPRAKASSTALIGLSLLGNLDGIYKHALFPSIELNTLTTGSRQRHGAMLLFGYTFKSKLWVSLGYDKNGFADGVVDKFWNEAIACIEQLLG